MIKFYVIISYKGKFFCKGWFKDSELIPYRVKGYTLQVKDTIDIPIIEKGIICY